MTHWTYNAAQATISAIDNGGCKIKIIDVYGGSEKERDEHGQLAAAAPELLAACKLAVRYIAKMVADEVKTALPPEIALKRVEAAIRNAEEGKNGAITK